jgi:hypothetical protein
MAHIMQKGSTRELLEGAHAWASLLEPLKNAPIGHFIIFFDAEFEPFFNDSSKGAHA